MVTTIDKVKVILTLQAQISTIGHTLGNIGFESPPTIIMIIKIMIIKMCKLSIIEVFKIYRVDPFDINRIIPHDPLFSHFIPKETYTLQN